MDNPLSHRSPFPLSLGDSGHFHPARLHPLGTFNIAPAWDENSGMTTRGILSPSHSVRNFGAPPFTTARAFCLPPQENFPRPPKIS